MEKRKTGNREYFGEMLQGAPQGAPWRTPNRMLREMPRGMPSGVYKNLCYCKLNVECFGC